MAALESREWGEVDVGATNVVRIGRHHGPVSNEDLKAEVGICV